MRLAPLALVAMLALAACSGEGAGSTSDSVSAPPATSQPAASGGQESSDELFPDILEATATLGADGTWEFTATVSSPYDSASRYADAWRVLAPDGTELGIRELLHDHAGEQPFTRSLTGLEVPDGISSVTIEGRDQVNGWGGATVEVALQP